MIERFFLKEPKNQKKQAVLWNTAANLISAVASVVLLLFVTRVNGTSEAGIFSIGYSTAQMLYPIGQFGMRNFQASDVQQRYKQSDYIASRVISCVIMMVVAFGFVLVKGYYAEKAAVLILMCLLKVTDSVDDVFGGYYQLNKRLDIGGKMQFCRIVLYIIVFLVIILTTKSTVIACAGAVVAATIELVYVISIVRKKFPEVRPVFRAERLKRLMLSCLPLCIGAFLIIYMGNAPKYAIDTYMASEYQAIYNYVFMPCYIICLFVQFVLQPLIVKMSTLWVKKEMKGFKKICGMIFALTVVLSAIIIVGGHFIGSYILGWLYGVDLRMYKIELTILLVGGAFYAIAIIIQTMLTIMRHQKYIIVGFILSSIIITIFAPIWVRTDGIMGAAWSYVLAAAVLFVVLLVCYIVGLQKEKRIITQTLSED